MFLLRKAAWNSWSSRGSGSCAQQSEVTLASTSSRRRSSTVRTHFCNLTETNKGNVPGIGAVALASGPGEGAAVAWSAVNLHEVVGTRKHRARSVRGLCAAMSLIRLIRGISWGYPGLMPLAIRRATADLHVPPSQAISSQPLPVAPCSWAALRSDCSRTQSVRASPSS